MHLPAMSALRAFESASRLLSYTKAADELFVTQSAISHQIRHLEDIIDTKLFERRGRRLILTEHGQLLAGVIRDFIDRLTSTLEEIHSEDDRGSLRVSMLQSFAFKWLIPRLADFRRTYEDIDVWISTSDGLADMEKQEADVAIRLGHGKWPSLYAKVLLREYVFPVCSPRFYESTGPFDSPVDLLRTRLLYRNAHDICPRWRDWFRDAGIKVPRMPKGSRFPDTGMTVQAAIDDQGVALARSAHVEDDLAHGRLIKLFNVHSPSPVAYYTVCPAGREDDLQVRAFIDWISAKAVVAQREFDRTAGFDV